ncbi:hypothetical protein PRK78_004134 [Emydomyces testavorans]|uniref:Thiolase-like protein type 1 additional C-terminal domain-containing protein n=1 Tax=Emydomyces testavorans TaxID=2070801 RepID=A0AAF0DHA5_9EURO|nr:hypothetical protein PRK78_004134 [Emydomyces testavorans]
MEKQTTTPVVIGVGDVKNASKQIEDAAEPLELILQAIDRALDDSGLPDQAAKEVLQSRIDSVDVVRTWTWPYPDLPGSIAGRLGIRPKHTAYSDHGGNSPGKLFDEAARRVASGQSTVALVTGGEALASLEAFARAKKIPPPGWTQPDEPVTTVFSVKNAKLKESLPVHVYPLYENGFRAHLRQSFAENNQESAQLYGEFAKIAEGNPYAWSYGKTAETPESIGTVTKRNRLICFPYPLLMNAFNTVNLAAACLLTSTEEARKLGVPESRWIYPLAGAGTADSDNCLPIINSPTPITLLGGLTSFGGAGNNYSLHAITAMVRQLRKDKGRRPRHGLILANGGVLTYQHVVILSSQPREDGSSYPSKNPLPDILKDVDVPVIDRRAEGEAVIETYTIEFNRDGTPFQGYVVGRLKRNNHRFIAHHADEISLKQLCSTSEEQIGRSGYVTSDGERNVFGFGRIGKL